MSLLIFIRHTPLLLQRPSPSLTGKDHLLSASPYETVKLFCSLCSIWRRPNTDPISLFAALPTLLLTLLSSSPCTYVTTGTPTWGTGSPKPTTTKVPPPVWTTTTVTTDVYTTYCPVPTTVVQGSKVCSTLPEDVTDC